MIVCTDVDQSEVVTDVIPFYIIPGHETLIRKPRKTASKKAKPSKVSKSSFPSMSVRMDASDVKNYEPSTVVKKTHSMTSLCLDPINVKPNVDASIKSYDVPKVMRNVETYENTNKPRSVMTLSKSSVIVAKRDNLDKDICVLICQVLGIEPKTVVVPDVSIYLAQTDNLIDESDEKPDSEHVLTKSPEKYEEKDDFDSMSRDSSNKEEKSGEKKDQSTKIVNVDDLDFDDEPIGNKLALGIVKRKTRLEILMKALFEEEAGGNLEGDNAGEEDASEEYANEEDVDSSDDEETSNSDED
ncbi:hypothetical protein KIW84_040682 [Lathyrus oleraceus]|uniref:Uncharacterized protein n=1 Tax=Pisum sativum TaxID=3888 RepID=A0A9D5AR49_PEA|nr:hypothetical protein KIW84_040682 [Pisum sativum]